LHADPDAPADRSLPVPHHQHPPVAAAVPPGLERVQAGVGGGRARLGLHRPLRHGAARRRPGDPPGRVPHPRRRGYARGGEGARPRSRGTRALAGGAALPQRPAGREGQEGDLPARTVPRYGRRWRMSEQGFTVWVTGPDPTAVGDVVDSLVGTLTARQLTVET